ncbi:MAG: hypothetical protein ACRDYA_21080, partial [Egibacteraceae bacterium]
LQIRRNVAGQTGETAVRIPFSFGCEGTLHPARRGGHAAAPMLAPVRVALEDPQVRPPKRALDPASRGCEGNPRGVARSRIPGTARILEHVPISQPTRGRVWTRWLRGPAEVRGHALANSPDARAS